MIFRVGITISIFHLIFLFASTQLYGQSLPAPIIPYGDNKDAGHSVELNGVRIYYEINGKGDPLVLIHGNGGNIAYMGPQIDYFRNHRRLGFRDVP